MRVLIAEDDPLVGDAVKRALISASFAADLVTNAEAAKAAVFADSFDLMIVDIGLPRESGLELVRGLRVRGKLVPVLMLTARDGLEDRVAALDLGADDYMTKPFQVAELIARCRALIRRANAVASTQFSIGQLKLDVARKEATVGETVLELTNREWSILECLAMNLGHIVSKDKLMSSIASFTEDLTPNAVEVYVSRLRAKLGDAAVIRAVRGMGYRIDETAA
ncbi:MAG TPA: response regulator transcription factor [Steroidobacteraceae bacterium]|jgi:DNA-binding response OmpR family regulator